MSQNASFSMPDFDGTFLNYARKVVSKDYWKFEPYYTSDDLLGEAAVVFYKCVRKYEGQIDNAAWLMSLFKTALSNRFVDLASKVSNLRTEVSSSFVNADSEDEEINLFDYIQDDNIDETAFEVYLESAPAPVKSLLQMHKNAPGMLLQQADQAWKERDKKKSFQNEHICRMFGYDHTQVDIVQMTKDFLRGASRNVA